MILTPGFPYEEGFLSQGQIHPFYPAILIKPGPERRN